jgi:hypothetical protein
MKPWIIVTLFIVMLIALGGCTPEQRFHCAFCKATGLCTLLGDDPNLQKPHVDWQDLKTWDIQAPEFFWPAYEADGNNPVLESARPLHRKHREMC